MHFITVKPRYMGLFALCFFLFITAFLLFYMGCQSLCKTLSANEIQTTVADNVIRLHVIANSDTEDDQTLKYHVRDAVLSVLQDKVSSAKTRADALQILRQEKTLLQTIATHTVLDAGYDYPIQICIEDRYFPEKTYGDMTFPAGIYQALCIEIGTAKGQNWWCVLFPNLCFIDETTATVPDTSKEKLQEVLPKQAYDSLLETPCAVSVASSSPTSDTPTPVDHTATEAPTPTDTRPLFRSALYDWFKP